MSLCVEQALQRYPFEPSERALVFWDAEKAKDNNFMFYGKELFMVHILFNLFKNALYHIQKANKGEIFIWLKPGERFNQLHLKDTGSGISAKVLPHIFDQFYTNTAHGSGIGLAFCKTSLQNMGGNIKCLSQEGEFAEFILSLPKN
jgi:signal transduction histidine kinase